MSLSDLITAPKEVVQPLPRARRRFLFLSLLTLFVCAVPIFAFYATGYRYDFFAMDASITATGGMYVSVPHEEAQVFLDNEPVRDSRVFREALYIQNLTPGVQRLHIQLDGYHTWVKELPVYPHMVTEAAAFQFPQRPLVRPITAFTTSTGTPIYLSVATSTAVVPFASTTIPILATSSKATTTLSSNPEYEFVVALFATTSATTTAPALVNRVVDEARSVFSPVATSTTATSTATTTIEVSNTKLYERNGDIYVRYTGPERNIPYYFCIPETVSASTSARYQAQHLAAQVAYATEMGLDSVSTTTIGRVCRREIKIDRGWQEIISFTFFPGTTDLILLHRADGIVVTEVDDRAWQNTQMLYPASAEALVVDGGRLYVKDGPYYFELLTELPTP